MLSLIHCKPLTHDLVQNKTIAQKAEREAAERRNDAGSSPKSEEGRPNAE